MRPVLATVGSDPHPIDPLSYLYAAVTAVAAGDPATLHFRDAATFWDWLAGGHPIGAGLIERLTPEQAATAREVLCGMLRERAAGG